MVDNKLLDTLTRGPIVLYEFNELLHVLIEELHGVYTGDSKYREPQLKHLFNDILIRIMEKGQPVNHMSNEIHPVVRESIAYMLTNLNGNITLDIISEKFGISKTYFSHLFHEHTGVSFKQYQLALRIEYAKRMLEEREFPIIDVGYECGFNTPSQFNRAFKGRVGMSPSLYRATFR